MLWSLFNSRPGRLLWAAILAASLATAGCAPMNLRGRNSRDDTARWGETQRRPGARSDLWGVSEQARQVERNLGVQ
jgi:hypothetical protein